MLLTVQISLSDCVYFMVSGNICVVIPCFPVYDIKNFEIKLGFLIKMFLYITKKSGQIYKYRKKEKSF